MAGVVSSVAAAAAAAATTMRLASSSSSSSSATSGCSQVSSSSSSSSQISSLLLAKRTVLASLHRVQRSAVRRLAVDGRLDSVPELQGSVTGSVAGAAIVSSLVEKAAENVALRNVTIFAMNALLVLPALAEEEKGKIFDFNLTLPIIAVQFLLLMVALDNIWFKPVAKVMDARDETIRSKLLGVRDNSGEIKKLQEEAEAIIKAARIETTMALNKTKRETAAALDEKLQESRARIEKELAQSLKNLEEQKEETLKSLDKQVQALSEEILRKVIPFKV